MPERRSFSSKLKILYAVLSGTLLSSNITERLSPLLTSCILLFSTDDGISLRSSENVISSIGRGLLFSRSIYIKKIATKDIRKTLTINFIGGFLNPIIDLLED